MPSLPGGRVPTPGYSPGGRKINPATARIADMPGGSDYLAGIGPAPAGLSAADMADPAAIVHGGKLSGPVGPGLSGLIRQYGLGGPGTDWTKSMFDIYNAIGYKPTNTKQQQWYNNGIWGAPVSQVYNPGGAANVAKPTNPLQQAIAASTQTSFAPTGSNNPIVNASLMGAAPAAPTPAAVPGTTLAPSGIQTPGITWGGNGGPYSQMSENYKQMTAGLTPAQILAKFKGP